jgi:hypothetical protein
MAVMETRFQSIEEEQKSLKHRLSHVENRTVTTDENVRAMMAHWKITPAPIKRKFIDDHKNDENSGDAGNANLLVPSEQGQGVIVFSSVWMGDYSECPFVNVTSIRNSLLCDRPYRSISPYISAFSGSIPQQPILASQQYRITLSKSPIIVHQVHALVPGRVSPKTYGSGPSIPILISNTDLNSSTTWRPSAQLPYGRHNHPLNSACDPETLTALV